MNESSDGTWVIRSTEIILDRPHLRLRADTIELPGGRIVPEYFVRETRGFSLVFALTADERVILVRQYKHGIGHVVLELPAGAIDEGENAKACAERELLEETGYACPGGLEPVCDFITDPTGSNGRAQFFFGRDAHRVAEQNLEATEQISVELVTLGELRDLVRRGEINVAIHVAAIYTLLDAPSVFSTGS
jgi:8-oxo-dGTP pyrophosphatase MutT (NUDIX family)